MRFSNVFGFFVVGSLTAASIVAGCGGDENGTTSTMSTTSSSTTTGAGPACAPKGAVCTAVDSDCIALEDNAGKDTVNLRMAQLTITEPALLSKGVVANLVGNGVLMNLEECNLAGGGTFSWILQFDVASGKVKTGGAKPTDDPTAGYCFVKEKSGNFDIAPITVDSGLKEGKFSGGVDNIIVPIYLDSMASTVVLMPLHEVVLDGTISDNNNCIGKYNADTLDPKSNCLAEPPDKLAFTNAGTLNGYITLEEADEVIIDTLGQSLCVLLSGDAATYGDTNTPKKCKLDMDGKILYKGKWCASTNAAATADCADAEKLGGQYAASAVKITGDCK